MNLNHNTVLSILVDRANAAHHHLPQYKGAWDGFELARMKRDFTTKLGDAFSKGQLVLVSVGKDDCPYDMYYTAYSPNTECNTSVGAPDFERLGSDYRLEEGSEDARWLQYTYSSRTGAEYKVISWDDRGGFVAERVSTGKTVKVSGALIDRITDGLRAGQTYAFQKSGVNGGISYTVAIEAGVIFALGTLVETATKGRCYRNRCWAEGAGTIDDHEEDADMIVIRDGCDAQRMDDRWMDAYRRRNALLKRTAEHLNVNMNEVVPGLLSLNSTRVAASWLLSN